jgi:hypothetical protein
MDFDRMLQELREERDRIEAVIATLEALAPPAGKKRGRPKGSKNKPVETARAASS